MKNYFAFLNEKNEIEIIDKKTGEPVAYGKEVEDDIGPTIEVYDGDKLVHIPKGMSLDDLRGERHKAFLYSEIIADIICQKIAEGSSITKVSQEKGFPSYSILCRWRKEVSEFDEAIEQAYIDRADYYHDMAIEAARSADTKDEVAIKRLQHDAYKWGAQVGKPQKFGTQTKLTGDAKAPLSFIIDTGIRREGDAGFEEPKDITVEKPQLEGDSDGGKQESVQGVSEEVKSEGSQGPEGQPESNA